MFRLLVRAVLALALPALPGFSPALASWAVVPDGFPTVQSAIDSGADTVQIREGVYPERAIVDHVMVLEGIGAGARPRLDGLSIYNTNFWAVPRRLGVSGIDFAGRVEHTTVYYRPRLLEVSFADCALEGGFYQVLYQDPDDVAFLTIRNCRLGGASRVRAYQVVMEADTVDGGVAWAVHWVWIERCWFRGGPGRAIELTDLPSPGRAAHNLIEGYETGMYVQDAESYQIEQNTILRCGTGIALGSGTDVNVVGNEILDCCVGVDIDMGEIWLIGNRVIGAQGPGIFAGSAGLVVEQNVVGHCGGDGIAIVDPGPTWEFDRAMLRGNTVFKNGGAGISVIRPFYGVAVERNIVFANAGWGLTVPPGADIALGCNDWYGNGGAVGGVAVGSTDRSVDPLFCGVDSADVRLDSGSPLADTAGCGQIGALGVGCGVTATLVQRFTAERVGEGIRVIWQVTEGATGSAVWLERSEAMAGGAWMRPLTERSYENRAVVELDRGAASDRRYWYRLVALEGDGVTEISAPIVVEAQARPEFRLVEVGPNPGSGPVRIGFSLEHAAEVAIDIFDVQGRRVATAGGGAWPAGTHAVAWDGRARNRELAPAGVYVVRYIHPRGQDRRAIVRLR